MKKLINKKILRILLIILGVILLGFIVSPFIFSKRVEINEFDQIYIKSNRFVLPKLISIEKRQDIGVKEAGLIKTEIISPEGKTGINELSYWDTWTWNTKLVKLEILRVSVESGNVYASLLLPAESSGLSPEKEYEIKCSVDETSVIYFRDPANRNDEYKPAIELLASGDLFYAYCLDSQCSSLGRRCIIER